MMQGEIVVESNRLMYDTDDVTASSSNVPIDVCPMPVSSVKRRCTSGEKRVSSKNRVKSLDIQTVRRQALPPTVPTDNASYLRFKHME